MRTRDPGRSVQELELIRRCIRGQAAAWNELIGQYGALVAHAVRTTLRRVLKNVDPNHVDEATQAIWASLCEDKCRRLKTFGGHSALSTWLTVISTRRALDLVRTEARKGSLRNVRLENEENSLLNDLKDANEQAQPLSEDEVQLVHDALDRLERDDRLILKFYYLDGLSYRTIAQLMKVAPNTVSSYIYRAREKLKQLMTRRS